MTITLSIYDSPDRAWVIVEGCRDDRPNACVQIRTERASLTNEDAISAIAEFLVKRLK